MKVHMLHAHLDKFKKNLGAYSEDQGECFRSISRKIQRNTKGDYVWGLISQTLYQHTVDVSSRFRKFVL